MKTNQPIAGGQGGTFWRIMLRKAALTLGSALLASALVSWIAANWQAATAMQKLVGVQVLLAVAVGLAWWLAWRGRTGSNRNFSLFAQLGALAGVGIGGLLALVGQTYQTGADTWQLFAWWGVLLLPWVLLVRTVFLALLWVVVVNVAAVLMQHDGLWGFAPWSGTFGFALTLALANLLLLVVFEWAVPRLQDAWRVGPRTLLSIVLCWMWQAQFQAHDRGLDGALALVPLAGLLLLIGLAIWYGKRRLDLGMLSLTAVYGLVFVATEVLARVDFEGGLLLLVPLQMVLVGLLLTWFSRLRRAHAKQAVALPTGGAAGDVPAADAPAALADDTPQDADGGARDPVGTWYLSMFRASAMWIVSWLMVLLLFVTLDMPLDRADAVGGFMLAVGILALHMVRAEAVREAAAAVAAAGFLLVCTTLIETGEASRYAMAAGMAVLGVAVYGLGKHAVLRGFCALATVAIVFFLTWRDNWMLFDFSTSIVEMMVLSIWLWGLAGGALACLLLPRKDQQAFWQPLAWALALSAQCLAWLAPAQWPILSSQAAWPWLAWVLRSAFVLLPVLALACMWHRTPSGLSRLVRLGAFVVLLVAGAGWMAAPGIALGLSWVLVGIGLRRREWLVFGVLGLLTYLGLFYYDLHLTLLYKAGLLGLMGAWFLAAGLVLRGRGGAVMARRRAPRHILIGLPAGLALVLGLVNADILAKQAVLRDGARVVLALAPADPRSLMQGDYMTLRYQATSSVNDLLYALPETARQARSGVAILQPDASGVHQVVAVHEQIQPLSDGQVAMIWHSKRGSPTIGVDSYFFPEGQAEQYEQAKFGEYRVMPDGTSLLTGLLDADQRRLP